MADVIQIKRSLTAGTIPADGSLAEGEFAVNIPDKKVWVGDTSGNPVLIVDEGDITPEASNVIYDNTSSGLTATNVQAAIDEVLSMLNSHVNDTNNPHDVTWDQISHPATFPPEQHGHDGGIF
jgi:hypothetical protein